MFRRAVPLVRGVGGIRLFRTSPLARSDAPSAELDVAIVGAGHNSLVAATLLAKQGLKVAVFEERSTVGGACKTERPFPKVPELSQSTGAYLLGVFPPELMTLLGLDLPLIRRDPHYFLPTKDGSGRYLLMGSDGAESRAQFERFFSREDWEAKERMEAEVGALRDDLAPAWLREPLSAEETALRYVRPELRERFLGLASSSVADYLSSFGFVSPTIAAMYAATDAFPGTAGGWDTPGTALNFLLHNMCRLPGSDGTWLAVRGGMGEVTSQLAERAREAGAEIVCGAKVCAVETTPSPSGPAVGARRASALVIERAESPGTASRKFATSFELRPARAILCGADPFTTRDLAGRSSFDGPFNAFLDARRLPGTTMKVNLALSALPTFSCLPEARGQHGTTTHLLPSDGSDAAAEGGAGSLVSALREAHGEALSGRLPDRPTVELLFHPPGDDAMRAASRPARGEPPGAARGGAAGHSAPYSCALFVQWVPNRLADGRPWAAAEDAYTDHLIDLVSEYAPDFRSCVADRFVLTPEKIQSHFGMSGGHIHHLDNIFAFDQRAPYRFGLEGLYSCSAGTHPGGSVAGCAGHNAARVVLEDLGLEPWWRVPL